MIDLVVQESVDVFRSLATDRYILRSFAKNHREHHPVLRVYATPGDVLSFGRFHRLPPAVHPRPWRRFSGGRILPFGDGFVGFSLLLPHRSALVSRQPEALAPYQVPNRYARGVVRALRSLGIDGQHPGRDFLLGNRKLVGGVSFETDDNGALLFEGILAVERTFAVLPGFLSAWDPEGALQAELPDEHEPGAIAEEGGRSFSLRELALALGEGFARQFRFRFAERQLGPLEERAIEAIATREFRNGWLRLRNGREHRGRTAATQTLLGMFEVQFGLEQGRFLRDVRFFGDFIANSASISMLERDLRLCPADWRSVALVADRVFRTPGNFIFGIGRLRTIPDTIVKALPT